MNAGTLEFLWADGQAYFSEMNTRIQVEHGVTELLTGVDLVQGAAPGGRGRALESRSRQMLLYVGTPSNAGSPPRAPTMVSSRASAPCMPISPPGGTGVRVDSHLYAGYAVPIYYDSLLAKLLTWGKDRAEAIARMDSRARRNTGSRG